MQNKPYLSDVTAENLYASGKISMDLLWDSKWDMRDECRVMMRKKRLLKEREHECSSTSQSTCGTSRSTVGPTYGIRKDEIAALFQVATTNFDISSPLYTLGKQINLTRLCTPHNEQADISSCTGTILTYFSEGQLPITSPRSAIVLLRNGLSLDSMTPAMQRDVKAKYLILCEQVSLGDVCRDFTVFRDQRLYAQSRLLGIRNVPTSSSKHDTSSVSSNGGTIMANTKLRFLQRQIQLEQEYSIKEQQERDRIKQNAAACAAAAQERKFKKLERLDQLKKSRTDKLRLQEEAHQKRQREMVIIEQKREEIRRQARENAQKKADERGQACAARLKNAKETLESEIAMRNRTFEDYLSKLQEREIQKQHHKQTVLAPLAEKQRAVLQEKRELTYNKCLENQAHRQATIICKQNEEDKRLVAFKQKMLNNRQDQNQKYLHLESKRNERLQAARQNVVERSNLMLRRCVAADAAADAASEKLRQEAAEKKRNIQLRNDQCRQRLDCHLRSVAFKNLQKLADIKDKAERVDLLLLDREMQKRSVRERQEQQRLQQELAEKELVQLQEAEKKKAFFALQQTTKPAAVIT